LPGLLTDCTLEHGTLGGQRDLAGAVNGSRGLDGLGLCGREVVSRSRGRS
jgi:hypothetical protein